MINRPSVAIERELSGLKTPALIIPQPTLEERFNAILPFARSLPIETILKTCFETFLNMVRSGELLPNKAGISDFGTLVDGIFDLTQDEQELFKRYFRSRRHLINQAVRKR